MTPTPNRYWLKALLAGSCACGGLVPTPALYASAPETPQQQVIVVERRVEGEAAEQKQAPKRWLGVMLKDIEGDLAIFLHDQDGVLISEVFPDSPAAKAGVQAGDLLIEVNGTKVSTPSDLLDQISKLEEGKDPQLSLVLTRFSAGEIEEVSLDVTLGERPAELQSQVAEVEMEIEGMSDEIARVVEGMRFGGFENAAEVVRIGAPAMVFNVDRDDVTENLNITVVSKEDDKVFKVTVKREEGEDAQIEVTTDGKTSSYTEENLDEAPGKVRQLVEPMLNGASGLRVLSFDVEGKKLTELEGNISEALKSMEVQIGAVSELKADEIAAKVRKATEKAMQAVEGAQAKAMQVRVLGTAAAGSAEVKELRAQVEELRAEVAKLRAELKGSDK